MEQKSNSAMVESGVYWYSNNQVAIMTEDKTSSYLYLYSLIE